MVILKPQSRKNCSSIFIYCPEEAKSFILKVCEAIPDLL